MLRDRSVTLIAAVIAIWLLTPQPMTLAIAQGAETDLSGQIAHLLDHIRTSSCAFIRNGSDHDAAAAADHIRKKYEYFQDRIHSADDFIDLAASKSALTGRPYEVRCPGQQPLPAADWLRAELRSYLDHAAPSEPGGAD